MQREKIESELFHGGNEIHFYKFEPFILIQILFLFISSLDNTFESELCHHRQYIMKSNVRKFQPLILLQILFLLDSSLVKRIVIDIDKYVT